ncbi:S-layer homology domain-containing protein [Fusibacter paucivorans]|uniref:S-layer homology domain-containing protein n=1 Tax=Fusibacter paucivorans TaxID=76009 RepID=A0ABS5PSY3_9FIRM|nr:S-layer homology domain-containing protein [Fusibacter paucivorans]MBS7527671.1 S-layer homology domain-containing protein [Fusibacter paucivorans]
MKKTMAAFVLLIAMMTSLPIAFAASDSILDTAVNSSAKYMYEKVKKPQIGSIGGEWAIIGLARSGYPLSQAYVADYTDSVQAYLEAHNGILDERKYTEYARVILALTAIGIDAREVAGYDLTRPLGDFEKTVWQGINGPIWALIALDSGNYPMPVNADAERQATRMLYVNEILSRQLDNGGWQLNAKGGSGNADPDLTGMALQALADYQENDRVKVATEKALKCLSEGQNQNGGYTSWGEENVEACVQVLVAMCELGIDLEDSRFVKNGHSLLDNILTFKQTDGSFSHTHSGGGSSQMASEQGLYGLVAAKRAANGENSLYRMSDALSISDGVISKMLPAGEGLRYKHKDVKAVPITKSAVYFTDIDGLANTDAIYALAARAIINGYTADQSFRPQNPMKGSEGAAMLTIALGLPLTEVMDSDHMTTGEWYAKYVETASQYGIISDNDDVAFNPNSLLTREQTAVMMARAAKLCGLETSLTPMAQRDILAGFTDYPTVSEWAREAVAYCYDAGILEDSAMTIDPNAPALRGEIAQMVYRLLKLSNLIEG